MAELLRHVPNARFDLFSTCADVQSHDAGISIAGLRMPSNMLKLFLFAREFRQAANALAAEIRMALGLDNDSCF